MTPPTVCHCRCHDTRGIEHPMGVDITDPFFAALACQDCVQQHDPEPRIEPTAWMPDDKEES